MNIKDKVLTKSSWGQDVFNEKISSVIFIFQIIIDNFLRFPLLYMESPIGNPFRCLLQMVLKNDYNGKCPFLFTNYIFSQQKLKKDIIIYSNLRLFNRSETLNSRLYLYSQSPIYSLSPLDVRSYTPLVFSIYSQDVNTCFIHKMDILQHKILSHKVH